MIKLYELVPKELQDKYGNVFFGKVDSFIAKQNAGEEDDTEHETKLAQILRRWQEASSVSRLDTAMESLTPFIPELKQIADENEWLKCKPGSTVYRGTAFTKENGKQLWERVLIKDRAIHSKRTSVTYFPRRRAVSSWSTSDSVANNFAHTALETMFSDLRSAIAAVSDPYPQGFRYACLSIIEMCCTRGYYSRESLIRLINSRSRTEEYFYTEDSFDKAFPNIEQLIFNEVLSEVDYQFPVVLAYEISSMDYCLFPDNLFTELLLNIRKGIANREAEVLFLDLPEKLSCKLVIKLDDEEED